MIAMEQNHLKYKDRINLGSFYTDLKHVDIAWDFIESHIDNNFIVLDSSCGYGNFLQKKINCRKIGNDIDDIAISTASNNIKDIHLFNYNALENVNRQKYNINENEKLCILGNPPYNDRTSIIRKGIKQINFNIDENIKTRDLGVSFLRSYDKLNADLVCVLHPLSYLIKKTNFNMLKDFSRNYKLIKGKIISSGSFKQASKTMQFPIVIALYEKDENGMSYDYIKNFNFQIEKDLFFKQNNFDYISNYIKKYPNKYAQANEDSVLFWTMRDINALKRNRTFIEKTSSNAIIVDKTKLDYYIYVDVFKRYANHIPYYLGNCDVIINNKLFLKFKKYFILDSLFYQPQLRKYYAKFDFSQKHYKNLAKEKINLYLKQLLGEHYAN